MATRFGWWKSERQKVGKWEGEKVNRAAQGSTSIVFEVADEALDLAGKGIR
jgi:hypothetical protein